MDVSLPSNKCLVSVTKVSDYCTWFLDAYSSLKADNYSASHFYGLLLCSEKLITWIQSKFSLPFHKKLCMYVYACVCVCVCVCVYIYIY